MASRNKRRQRQRRRLKRKIYVYSIRFIIFLVVVLFVFRGCSAHFHRTIEKSISKASQYIIDSDKYAEASYVPSEEEMKEHIKDNKGLYPKYLRKFVKNYPEALKFVYDYPEESETVKEIDLSNDYTKGEIPAFTQWDKRWGYIPLGNQIIGTAGCGPTCLSMVYIGLTGDTSMDPSEMAEMAEEKGYFADSSGSEWSLFTEGAVDLGLNVHKLSLDEKKVKEHLEQGHPIVVNLSEGRFTVSGHYLVFAGIEDGKIRIHDPNSPSNTEQLWEWKDFDGQIKNLWAFSKAKEKKKDKSKDTSKDKSKGKSKDKDKEKGSD